jgi:Cys-rich protein (TIGR01571 family)
MGQVMQRLRLDWLGRQTTEIEARSTFRVCAVLFATYRIYSLFLFPPLVYGKETVEYFLRSVGRLLFFLWTVYAISNTRAFVRAKYQIPEEICPGYEDVFCAVFCQCCTIAQISRHTGQHEDYPSVCISETGLPPQAPMLV